MAELRLSGLSTGIDTQKIIDQLMEVNRRRLYMMQDDVSKHEEKRSAMSELQGKLTALKTTAGDLSDSSQLRSYNAVTSDDDYITVEANSNASEGNHSVQVKQLATSDRWIHDGFKYATSLVGAGTFILSYNFKELSITTTAETTLEDLVGLINNDSDNPGINASLLKYDDGSGGIYHLVLNGRESGSDYQIKINSSSTEVHVSDTTFQDTNGNDADGTTRLTDLGGFSGTMGSGSTPDSITVGGTEHDGTVVNYTFNVNEHTTMADVIGEINEAFDTTAKAVLEDGHIIITDATCGASSMTLTLTFNAGTGSDASLSFGTFSQQTAGGTAADLAGFEASTFTETQTAQDSKIRVNGYPGDGMAAAEVQQLSSTANATAGTYTLTFMGETTAALNYNDDIATVQAALNALSTISAVGGVTVGGTPPSDSGSAMTFTFSADAGDVERIRIDTSSLTGGTHTISTQTQGRDGWINRSTNTIDDVISGVTLKLHDTTEDGAGGYNNIEVNLTRDTETLKEKIDELITAYNTVVMFIQEKTAYDAEEGKSGILANEYSVTTIWNQIKLPFTEATSGFGGDDSFTMPGDIGITLGADGMLKFDSTDFDEAVVDDYLGVLSLIGAMKTGSSDSNDIKFYGASKFTTAGEFEVRVYGDGSQITSAQIREVGGEWRDATFDGNMVTGDSTFDSNGNPLYPENSLQVTVDVSKTSATPLTATITVKHGYAGALKETLDKLLHSTKGRVPISIDSIDTQIKNTNDRIEREETRLEGIEKRLIDKFSRLEKTLAMIQQQMGALNMLSS